MKKYFSSLIVLTLFLNSFSVFAMKKIALRQAQDDREDEQEYRRVLNSTTGMNVRIEGDEVQGFSQLCDDVIFYDIFPYADLETLKNLRLVNSRSKQEVDKFITEICLKDFENGILKRFAYWPAIKQKKVQELLKKLEAKFKKRKNISLLYRGEESRMTLLNSENFKDKVLEILDQYQKDINRRKLNRGARYCLRRSSLFEPFIQRSRVKGITVVFLIFLFFLATSYKDGYYACSKIFALISLFLGGLIAKSKISEMRLGERLWYVTPEENFLMSLGIYVDSIKQEEELEKAIYTEEELREKKNQ